MSDTPRFATWLLERLAVSDEALIGDLYEEAGSRSRLWLLWQVAVAILSSNLRQVRRHPVVAIRLAITGCTVGLAMTRLLGPVSGWVLHQIVQIFFGPTFLA